MRAAAALLALLLAAPLAAGVAPLPAAPPAVDVTVTVDATCLGGCVFVPPVLRVAPGDTVVWRIGNLCHSATAGLANEAEPFEGNAAAPGLNAFDTGVACAGTVRHTFTQAGAFPYYCKEGLHRALGMHGLVVVA